MGRYEGNSIPLYLSGCTGAIVGGFDLIISNLGPTNSPHDYINESILLYTKGGWVADNNSFVMAMPYTHAIETEGLKMYISGTFTAVNSYMQLFLKNVTESLVESLQLYIANDGASSFMPLYIWGAGFYAGYYQTGGSVDLFLQRDDVAAGVQPLYLKAVDPGVNSYMYLILKADAQEYGNLDLYTYGSYLWSSTPNSYIPLFLAASLYSEQGMLLFIQNNLIEEGYLPLVLCHKFGMPNGYIPLFLKHTGSPANSSLEMAIPYTKESNTGLLKLYIHGY